MRWRKTANWCSLPSEMDAAKKLGILSKGSSNIAIAMECNVRATEINNLRGDWECRNGTTALMKAFDNQTGNEVYLVSTNAPTQKDAVQRRCVHVFQKIILNNYTFN